MALAKVRATTTYISSETSRRLEIVKLCLFFVGRPILTTKKIPFSFQHSVYMRLSYFLFLPVNLILFNHFPSLCLSYIIQLSPSLSLYSLFATKYIHRLTTFLMRFARTFIFSQQSINDEYRNSIDDRITAPRDCC